MSKPNKNFICFVDNYRRPSRQRNTHGRYRVGAKTESEAKEILQKLIGFGSIQVCCESKNVTVPYKKAQKEIYNPKTNDYDLIPIRHANAAQPHDDT